jgi:flagellar motility protein MotE (MotC chaperone)
MEFRLRLVPVAIVAILGLLGIKLGDAWLVVYAPVAAAQTPAPDAVSAPTPTPAAPAAPAASAPATGPAAAATSKTPRPLAAAKQPATVDPLSMSPSEVELLQRLSDRRAELDRRAAELSQREVLLQAAEKRVDQKIAKLEALKQQIGGIVDKQNQEDDARFKSLVKIYETMKPVDAARIFSQLDMPVLLGVFEHMKERIAAPILAAMDPSKAKALTLALAERRNQTAQAETPSAKPAQKPAANR